MNPSTAQTTEEPIAVADRSHVVAKRAAVPALRQRLAVAGDIGLNSGELEVFDSYVDAALRRFQKG